MQTGPLHQLTARTGRSVEISPAAKQNGNLAELLFKHSGSQMDLQRFNDLA